VWVTTPALLLAVSIYAVASSGVTTLVPEASTVPRLGVIEIEVAPLTCHCKVAVSPSGITVGLAEKLSIKGHPVSEITDNTTEAVTEPALLVAVRVYVFVVGGDTCSSPAPATAPIPWSIEIEVAPPTCQSNLERPPGCMLVGYIAKRDITGRAVC